MLLLLLLLVVLLVLLSGMVDSRSLSISMVRLYGDGWDSGKHFSFLFRTGVQPESLWCISSCYSLSFRASRVSEYPFAHVSTFQNLFCPFGAYPTVPHDPKVCKTSFPRR